MRFTLILTGNERHDDLLRFFSSLRDQQRSSQVDLRFVNQGAFLLPPGFVFPPGVDYQVHEIGHQLPLSRARNLAMEDLLGDIVAFPDDDCWYPPTLLGAVTRFFQANPETDCLCTCVFDPVTKKTYGNRPLDLETEVGFANLFKLPSSVGIFVRREALLRGGAFFDETLGAGTELGSGEEIDLIARMLHTGARIRYVGALHVYHPVSDFVVEDVRKYYLYGLGFGFLNGRLVARGSLQVLAFCCSIGLRSAAGFFVHLGNPLKRRLYAGRLRGIVSGFVRGYREG